MWLCRHRNGVGNIKPLLTPKIAFYCITKRAYRRYDDTPVLPCTLYDSYPDSVYCCYCFMSSYLVNSCALTIDTEPKIFCLLFTVYVPRPDRSAGSTPRRRRRCACSWGYSR